MRKLINRKNCLDHVASKENFLKLNGGLVPELSALIRLMSMCGVYRLITVTDYWTLAVRTYTLFGGTPMLDELFLNDVFLKFRMLKDFNKKVGIKTEEKRALEQGSLLRLTIEDLSLLRGLELNDKENVKESEFLEKLSSKMYRSWSYRYEFPGKSALITSCYKTNVELKECIKNKLILPPKHFLDAAFWAGEVVKYI